MKISFKFPLKSTISIIIIILLSLIFIFKLNATLTSIIAANNTPEELKLKADYVCDGIKDNIEIQDAVYNASGKKVMLLPGIYDIQKEIILINNTEISGAGKSTVISPTSNNLTHVPSMFIATKKENIIIKNLSLDGSRINKGTPRLNLIQFENCNNILIENVVIKNFIQSFKHSIWVAKRSSNITIKDCVFDNCDTSVRVCTSDSAVIMDNLFTNIQPAFYERMGTLIICSPRNYIVERNIFEGYLTNYGAIRIGHYYRNSRNLTIRNNTIIGNKGDNGITLIGGAYNLSDFKIINNTIQDVNYGIWYYNGDEEAKGKPLNLTNTSISNNKMINVIQEVDIMKRGANFYNVHYPNQKMSVAFPPLHSDATNHDSQVL